MALFTKGDIVTVVGYEELGPGEITLIDKSEGFYPYFVEWCAEDNDYNGFFNSSQLKLFERVDVV